MTLRILFWCCNHLHFSLFFVHFFKYTSTQLIHTGYNKDLKSDIIPPTHRVISPLYYVVRLIFWCVFVC